MFLRALAFLALAWTGLAHAAPACGQPRAAASAPQNDVRSWLLPGVCCALLYFAMSYPLGRVARRIEKKLAGEHVVDEQAPREAVA